MFGFSRQYPQAILAFILGVFLAHITIKHNSILPAIIVHAVVNSFSILNTIGYEYLGENIATIIFGSLMLLIIFGGLALFIYSLVTKKGVYLDRLGHNAREVHRLCFHLGYSLLPCWFTSLLH